MHLVEKEPKVSHILVIKNFKSNPINIFWSFKESVVITKGED